MGWITPRRGNGDANHDYLKVVEGATKPLGFFERVFEKHCYHPVTYLPCLSTQTVGPSCYNRSMNTETVTKIPATGIRVGTVLADGAVVTGLGMAGNYKGTGYGRMVYTRSWTATGNRWINLAGTQTVQIP